MGTIDSYQIELQAEVTRLNDQIATRLVRGEDVSDLQREVATKAAALSNIPALAEASQRAALDLQREKESSVYAGIVRQVEQVNTDLRAVEDEIAILEAQLKPLLLRRDGLERQRAALRGQQDHQGRVLTRLGVGKHDIN